MDHRDWAREAVALLFDAVQDRLDRHPLGHLVHNARSRLPLRLSLPLFPHEAALAASAEELASLVERAVDQLLAEAAVFRPGRVFCLRCQRADCDHSAPTDARAVFAGFGPTGAPRFVDFGQLLLDRRDPRVEQLYDEDSSILVACVLPESELSADLLPAFRDAERDYRIHGQVAAGWYRVPDHGGGREALAIALQVISARPQGGRRRFGLNVVVGPGPDGETVERLIEHLGHAPWAPAARWGQSVLTRIGASWRSGADEAALRRRIDGLLAGVARRVSRVQRARDRRTAHAEQRHAGGDRPTRMAVLDLSRAPDRDFLFDTRRRTVIVLGERGRAHVFGADGRLVTSLRCGPQTVARRRASGVWRLAAPEEVMALRARVALPPT